MLNAVALMKFHVVDFYPAQRRQMFAVVSDWPLRQGAKFESCSHLKRSQDSFNQLNMNNKRTGLHPASIFRSRLDTDRP